ncbi:MAG: glucokinase [Burkholderiales bacterium]|nr:glucokinase [Burkholderiales bacterium]
MRAMTGERCALVADVGATKTHFALARLEGGAPRLAFVRRFEDRAYASFEAALAAYLAEARAALGTLALEGACFAAAGPVAERQVRLTNRDWVLDADALRAQLAAPVALENDFACAARGVEWLGAGDLVVLQPGEPLAAAPRVVIGAGTGLGVAYLAPSACGWIAIAGEGGHIGFAPQTDAQAALWRWLRAARARVACEDVLSGPGLAAIYAFLLGRPPGERGPEAAAVEQAAEAGEPAAVRALELFCEIYGQGAGDHALAVLARGGVYVAGGIARRIVARLRAGGFVRAFADKGVHAALARRMPVYVVTNEHLELLGAAAIALDLRQRPVKESG